MNAVPPQSVQGAFGPSVVHHPKGDRSIREGAYKSIIPGDDRQAAVGSVESVAGKKNKTPSPDYKFGDNGSGFYIRGKLDAKDNTLYYEIVANHEDKAIYYKKRMDGGQIYGAASIHDGNELKDGDYRAKYVRERDGKGQMTGRWLFHSMMDYYDNNNLKVDTIAGEWLDAHPRLADNARSYRNARNESLATNEAAYRTFGGKMAYERGYVRATVTEVEGMFTTGRQVRTEEGMNKAEKMLSTKILVKFRRPPASE